MHVSRETPGQTEKRLREVIARATLVVDGRLWRFEEFPLERFPGTVRADAIALVRDEERWSQLVPVEARDVTGERFRVWTFHFDSALDNSGFVGWLANRIKRKTGSGIFVVCGYNYTRGGIYDHWGCPEGAAERVLAEVRALAAAQSE